MKAFITVIGKDRVGIIADVSAVLKSLNINIEDISQTILQGNFTMIMAVSICDMNKTFQDINNILCETGKKLGVEITVRHMDIFEAMHRI